jgi:uncharacterized protein (DUF1684 family)
MPRLIAALCLVALAAPALAAPARPVRLSAAEADSLRAAIEKDRFETLDWLRTSGTSYLATIRRVDFESKPALTVGRAPDNDVRIDDPGIEPHHLRVTVAGDSFRVEALDQAARFKVKDAETRGAVVGPSTLGAGRFLLRLSHQRFPAIIVFDPQSPRFAGYKGLRWFPADLAYRYVLRLTPKARPDTVVILSTRGNQRHALRVGWFDFTVGGKACRLEATRLLEPGVGERDLGVFFRDATSGKESYGLGRYLDVEPLEDGRYVLDFNFAYNPACAVSDHYNCPIPPKANTLRVAIRAGEMDSHYHAP